MSHSTISIGTITRKALTDLNSSPFEPHLLYYLPPPPSSTSSTKSDAREDCGYYDTHTTTNDDNDLPILSMIVEVVPEFRTTNPITNHLNGDENAHMTTTTSTTTGGDGDGDNAWIAAATQPVLLRLNPSLEEFMILSSISRSRCSSSHDDDNRNIEGAMEERSEYEQFQRRRHDDTTNKDKHTNEDAPSIMSKLSSPTATATTIPVRIEQIMETPQYSCIGQRPRPFDWNATVPVTSNLFHLQKLDSFCDLASLEMQMQMQLQSGTTRDSKFHLSITLQFIHSSDEEYDRYFTSSATVDGGGDADDDDDDNGGEGEDSAIYEIVRQNLEYRFIRIGSVLAIDLPSLSIIGTSKSNTTRRTRQRGTTTTTTQNKSIAFFLVEDVRPTMIDTHYLDMPPITNKTYYRTNSWENLSFHISKVNVGSPPADDGILTDASGGGGDSTKDETASTKEYEQEDEESGVRRRHQSTANICPGYENLVKEIVAMADITIHAGSPTAILLTGCAGVGKSRLTSSIIYELTKDSEDATRSSPSSTSSSTISMLSAKDILLEASSSASSTEESKLKRMISLPNNDATTTSPRRRAILVIDDLDILFGDTDNGDEAVVSGTSSIDYERIASLNAVLGAIDDIVATTRRRDHRRDHQHNYLPLILGICCTEPSQIPSNIVRVGRFEKVVSMLPPSDLQRRAILIHLLTSFPLSAIGEEEGGSSGEKRHHRGGTDIVESWADVLAPRTAGCVAADLKRMCIDAFTRAMSHHRPSIPQSNTQYRGGGSGGGGQTIADMISSIQISTRGYDRDDNSGDGVVVSWSDMKDAARSCIPSQLAQLDVMVSRPITFADDAVGPSSSLSLVEKERWIYHQSWIKFGGYGDMKANVYRKVVRPWKRHFTSLGDSGGSNDKNVCSLLEKQVLPPSGVLFHGPPGTGKSSASECLASALCMNVVKVRVSDILDRWLGGSEAAMRSLFTRARAAAPCILFFDEIDALATNRSNEDGGGSTDVHSRLLSTMLNEMDGISSGNKTILVVATTNRIHAIDAALLRPGRLEEHVLLDRPTVDDIREMLDMHLASTPLDDGVRSSDIAELLRELGASGADIKGICTDACMRCIGRADVDSDVSTLAVGLEDFEASIILWKK